MPNLVFLPRLSFQILGKTQTGIFDFPISGQSLIKRNCYSSRTSDYFDIKLGPVTKTDKRNKINVKKKIENDVMPENSESGRIVYKTRFFIYSNLLF